MFKNILYGKNGAQELVDSKVIGELLKTVENYCKNSHKNYQFLGDNDLFVLKKYKHMICFNTKQKPVLLFLTKINQVNYFIC